MKSVLRPFNALLLALLLLIVGLLVFRSSQEAPTLPALDDACCIELTAQQEALSAAKLTLLARQLNYDWAESAPVASAADLVGIGVAPNAVRDVVLEYCRRKPTVFVGVLSPRAHKARDEVKRLLQDLGTLVFDRDILLAGNAPRALLLNMYGKLCDRPMRWIKDDVAVGRHLRSRFCVDTPASVFIFEAPSLEHAIAWKRYIRKVSGIGTVGLHVTDTHREAVRLAELLLDDSALAHLN